MNSTVPWGNDPNANYPFVFDPSDPCFVKWKQSGISPYGEAAPPLSLRHKSSQSKNDDHDIWVCDFAGAQVRSLYPGFSNLSPAPNTMPMSILKTQTTVRSRSGHIALK